MMNNYILPKENLPKFIMELIGKYKIFAPVEDNEVTLFKQINNSKDINLKYTNSKERLISVVAIFVFF